MVPLKKLVISLSKACIYFLIYPNNAPSHLCNALRVFLMQRVAIYSVTLLINGRVASQNNAQRVA